VLSFLTAVVLGASCSRATGDSREPGARVRRVLAGLVLLLLTGQRRGGLGAAVGPVASGCTAAGPTAWRAAKSKRATRRSWTNRSPSSITGRPPRFVQSAALEYLSRSIFMIELVLIAMGVGLSITFAFQARTVNRGSHGRSVQNVIFVVPFEVRDQGGSLTSCPAAGARPGPRVLYRHREPPCGISSGSGRAGLGVALRTGAQKSAAAP